jgi:hypothetical protein
MVLLHKSYVCGALQLKAFLEKHSCYVNIKCSFYIKYIIPVIELPGRYWALVLKYLKLTLVGLLMYVQVCTFIKETELVQSQLVTQHL